MDLVFEVLTLIYHICVNNLANDTYCNITHNERAIKGILVFFSSNNLKKGLIVNLHTNKCFDRSMEVKLQATLQGNLGRQTIRPTNRSTDSPGHREVAFPIKWTFFMHVQYLSLTWKFTSRLFRFLIEWSQINLKLNVKIRMEIGIFNSISKYVHTYRIKIVFFFYSFIYSIQIRILKVAFFLFQCQKLLIIFIITVYSIRKNLKPLKITHKKYL